MKYYNFKEKKMRAKLKVFLVLFCSVLVFACVSTAASRGKYRIVFDSEISNPFVQSVWFSYIAPIREDMDEFYGENPEPEKEYSIPYKVEVDARNRMIDFYLHVQNEYKISDQYLEDLMQIRSSNKLNEYVFFSFNPGNWINENKFNEEEYKLWMENNMPAHVPLTLVYIEKNY
jgi:hypothetical protein